MRRILCSCFGIMPNVEASTFSHYHGWKAGAFCPITSAPSHCCHPCLLSQRGSSKRRPPRVCACTRLHRLRYGRGKRGELDKEREGRGQRLPYMESTGAEIVIVVRLMKQRVKVTWQGAVQKLSRG